MFQAIAGKVPILSEEIVADLSSDSKYLYKMSLAVQSGPVDFPADLQFASPGSLNHARWLTLANRVLRLYVSEKKTSIKLRNLVCYIQNCYAPTWFLFKKDFLLIHGSRNLFFLLEQVKRLPEIIRKPAQRSIQANAYLAHSENLLLSMLADMDSLPRKQAVDTILRIRNEAKSTLDECPRKFLLNLNLIFSRVINFLLGPENVFENDLPALSGCASSAASTDLAPWEREPKGEGVTIPCSLSG